MANIKVAVRVRPISARELNRTGSDVVVHTDSNGISLTNLKVSSSKAGDSRERTRRYGFDYCFDSSNSDAENFADQERIYETLGQTVLEAVLSGYNSCLVAYGQSASGKTYTMMGTKEDPGLTPRLCEGLFARIEEDRKNQKNCSVSVSYLEIYNERVRDLLKPSSSASGLRVREHPRLGPYVQGLTHHVVRTLGSLMSYVEEGTRARKTASTLQNPSSSRSHALLTIAVTPEPSSVACGTSSASASSSTRRGKGSPPRGGSKLRLVDLAGSESAATCGGIHRLKEGANINKSLVALGNVISALAERGSTGSGPGRRFIPYRDSSLTWLLKDALGGNATTIMLATISPASGSYNETAHTLRFAQRAQSVVNRPVVNEDPVARVIRELRDEVARLKSLLLEKKIEPTQALCSCQKIQDQSSNFKAIEAQPEESKVLIEPYEDPDPDSKNEDSQRDSKPEEYQVSRGILPLRRSTSTESLTTLDTGCHLKRFGSYELLSSKDRFERTCNRARVTELNDEEDEVSEIHESVFVDIPTLVAVLIKPDDSLQESSTQLEEICSDDVAEDGIDVEFIGHEHEGFDDPEKPESIDHDDRSSSVNSCQASGDNEIDVYQSEIYKSTPNLKEKPKFRKQDSVDLLSAPLPTNLHTSKRFGSVETIQRKKEPLFSLERSHTSLERRSVVPERAKKLNNIREIDDQKSVKKSLWLSSKEPLQRKGSNDSDKSLKDSQSSGKGKNVRKPSLENLKRKTSKDSSSSSSKDEQILISNLTRDKLLHRKDSIEQESPSTRSHTPIQRVKRAQIVAAVTERLYSSKKVPEDVSGSPPEGTEVKSLARMKLQEISRKMLGKRRRVCVDTQTDCARTIRMRDTASSTEMPEIQDVAVLTDNHEDCEIVAERRTPVLRVKEMATITDKPKTSIVRCKDVASLANDLDEYEYELHSPRHDSGILSDDTQNYAESNLSSTEVSDVCHENDHRAAMHVESSTNTLYSSCRNFAVQTPRPNTLDPRRIESKAPACLRQCCNPVHEPRNPSSVGSPEKSVISISLPDTISITIESTNVIESRIAVTDTLEQDKARSRTRDGEVQTEEAKDTRPEIVCFKDDSRSTLSQTDGRVFRIENIFQDPNNVSRRVDGAGGRVDGARMRNSITFRNSLGTSYVSQVRDGEVGGFGGRRPGEGFIRDGLITEAFITKKRFDFGREEDPWRQWSVPGAVNKIHNFGCNERPSSWQSKVGEIAGLTLSCSNCTPENGFMYSKIDHEVQGDPKSSENGASEHDHSFSDDSLDYNENNVIGQTMLKMGECELRETICPPDVVAHTKKDCPKVAALEAECNELGDFEDSQVEFPKIKPSEGEVLQVHDYKDLILGRPSYSFKDVNEDPEDSNRVNSSGKKKVSFSSSPEVDDKVSLENEAPKQSPKTSLKSIIKKRKKRSVSEIVDGVQSSNDETDDSQQEEKSSKLEDDWEEKVQARDAEEKSKEGLVSENSESDSCENIEDEEEDVPCDHAAKKILKEYLSEAVTFMRNLNSINESINVASVLERCSSPSHQKRVGKQESRRRSSSSSWNLDHQRQEVFVTDDADYPESDEDIVVSTESYDRCLNGIQRLEDCIRRVDRHNELLRVKYGVNCGSAGARLSLANPSTDRAPMTSEFVVSDRREDNSNVIEDWTSPTFTDYHPKPSQQSAKSQNVDDDLEKRIFDQLMNVANATSCRASSRLQNRFSKTPDHRTRSPITYSKLREKYNHANESFCGDLRGSLDVNEPSCTSYEITGNLSVARTQGMSFDDLESIVEDDFLPLRRLDRIEGKLHVDSSRSQRDDSSNSTFRRAKYRDDSDDEYLGLKSSYSSQRVADLSPVRGFQELNDYSRRIRDGSKAFPKDEGSNDILQFRDKLKYPGSPRARFLELLRERRRIVESSRGTSAS
ncbi:uncharacterized protein LOC143210285 isoform X2 [Lasioglossum baleicum]|uniref:uncharacterized protein LOC143210285 isoform X2 n=1 Tax=Lasioglossum baleicum TaxID=434251 RepID=UPI003FCEC0FB